MGKSSPFKGLRATELRGILRWMWQRWPSFFTRPPYTTARSRSAHRSTIGGTGTPHTSMHASTAAHPKTRRGPRTGTWRRFATSSLREPAFRPARHPSDHATTPANGGDDWLAGGSFVDNRCKVVEVDLLVHVLILVRLVELLMKRLQRCRRDGPGTPGVVPPTVPAQMLPVLGASEVAQVEMRVATVMAADATHRLAGLQRQNELK